MRNRASLLWSVISVISATSSALVHADDDLREESIKASNPIAFATKVILDEMYLPGSGENPDVNEFQLNIVAPYPLNHKFNLINKLKLPWDTLPYVNNSGRLSSETALNDVNYTAYVTNANDFEYDNSLKLSFGLGPSITFDTSNFDNIDNNKGGALGVSGLVVAKTDSFMGLAGYQYNWALESEGKDVQNLQVVAAYNWKNGFSVNMAPYLTKTQGEDWYIPLGVGVGQFFKIAGKIPVKLIANAYYNVSTPRSLDQYDWQYQVGIIIMGPSIFGIPLGAPPPQ